MNKQKKIPTEDIFAKPIFTGDALAKPVSVQSRKNETTNFEINDPHNLHERFVVWQAKEFAIAHSEISQGEKVTCWLWFILPTAPYIVNGKEVGSYMNKRYALRGDDAVEAYLKRNRDDIDESGVNLRRNYISIIKAVEDQLIHGNTMKKLFPGDDVKAISSIELFYRIGVKMNDLELVALCSSVLILAQKPQQRKR